MDLQPSLPTYDDLFEPTIKALKALGGSGSIQEIYDKVCELEAYSEEQQSVLHKGGSQTEINCLMLLISVLVPLNWQLEALEIEYPRLCLYLYLSRLSHLIEN